MNRKRSLNLWNTLKCSISQNKSIVRSRRLERIETTSASCRLSQSDTALAIDGKLSQSRGECSSSVADASMKSSPPVRMRRTPDKVCHHTLCPQTPSYRENGC